MTCAELIDEAEIVMRYQKSRGLGRRDVELLSELEIPPAKWIGSVDRGEWAPRRSHVVFGLDWFDFLDETRGAQSTPALIFPSVSMEGTWIDLVAASLRPARLASWRGRAIMLGETQIDAWRGDKPLRVWTGVLPWLRASRHGVVLIDMERARWRLSGYALAAENAEHGVALQAAMALPNPKVMVPKAQPERRAS